jgi:hypothetical protein
MLLVMFILMGCSYKRVKTLDGVSIEVSTSAKKGDTIMIMTSYGDTWSPAESNKENAGFTSDTTVTDKDGYQVTYRRAVVE